MHSPSAQPQTLGGIHQMLHEPLRLSQGWHEDGSTVVMASRKGTETKLNKYQFSLDKIRNRREET